ncbi:hypothetical protein HY213_04785 [Candidatus Peregrinibacteria bacterium]|nr:hypothetical protein [Candidatus Peregrinibacteria bacterium]
MFALDPIHPLYSAIIDMVAVYPQCTIAQLHEHLRSKRKVTVSLPQLYRVVTRMLNGQILIKIEGTLSLNLMWVSYLEFLAGRAKRILQRVEEFPLRLGEKKVYLAHSFLDIEAIWNHVLVSLYRLLQERTLYKYYSHAWWQLGRNAEEIGFYKELKEAGIDCHWVFGNDTALDRIGAQRIHEVFPAVTAKGAPFPSAGYNLNVYGEYVIECILPEKIARHFAFFFDRVKTMEEFDHDLFLDIFTMRGSYKLTVWRNAKQAELLRGKLRKYF